MSIAPAVTLAPDRVYGNTVTMITRGPVGTQGVPPLTEARPGPLPAYYDPSMPDPQAGGYVPDGGWLGRTVDMGYSPDLYQGQFYNPPQYDTIPVPSHEAPGIGPVSPNTQAYALRAGILYNMTGYTAPTNAALLPYVASLTGESNG